MQTIEYIFQKFYDLLVESFEKSLDAEYFIILFGATASLLLVEMFFAGWEKSSLRKIIRFDISARNDFFAWFIEALGFFGIISALLSFGVCYYLVGFIQINVGFDFTISNPYIQILVIIIVSDLKNYVRHYFFHRSHTLWQLHSFHHSATNFNILTRQRAHFLEGEISRFFDVLPFVLFGAPILSYFIVRLVLEIHQMLLHSAFKSDWGFIGKYIIVSPAAHRIHHSVDPKHYNKNLGNTFIFWDHLFGTYHPKEDNIEIGIPNNPYNKGYVRDILTGQYLFFKTLWAGTKGLFQRKKSS